MKPFQKYAAEFDQLTDKEQFLLEKCLYSVEKFVENSRQISSTDYATRGAHSKTYGILKGILEMEEELPPMVRDVFSEDHYEVICRLSHSNPVINSSKNEIPAFGFALKIKNIADGDANFPLANFPLFPMKSASAFLKFFTSLNTFLVTKADNFVVSAMDLPHLIRNSAGFIFPAVSFEFLKNISRTVTSKNNFILSFDYHSIGVFRLGDFMMKLKLVPHYRHKDFEKNFDQRTRTENYINSTDTDFDLMMQFCSDLKKQPVNDLTREWRKAPFIKIGTLKIPQNSLLNPEDPKQEKLSFNPFENPENLQPVGKIQQLRKEVYRVSAETRNRMNF